ncbi:type II toxin-antitoxin system PemK/MazF family toxin [Candidatus Pacearchaeota archaeon]|nr:type II toxin-antitoxin system PemK/MazF family toxin [Candidatus Pacearchaeota archaeon]
MKQIYTKGDIIVTYFPFTDLTSVIKRPALVVANLDGDDIILCEITTKERADKDKIELNMKDIESGSLKIKSFIRPSRLFTLRKKLIIYKFGSLKKEKIIEVERKLCEIFKRN